MSAAEVKLPPKTPGVITRVAALMLVACAFLWGLSFPLIKDWFNAAEQSDFPGGTDSAVLTLLGLRMTLALLVFVACQPHVLRGLGRRELRLGLLLGVINGIGTALQVWGLATTSPALSVFLTSLASAWVPLVAFVCFRVTAPALTLLGLFVGMMGVLVLGIQGDVDWVLGPGEWLTLASSMVFAVVIVLIDRWGRALPPGDITFGILAALGPPCLLVGLVGSANGAGIGVWLEAVVRLLQQPRVLAAFVLLTVTPILAFWWMSKYQPRVAASRAALIYLLEPVFGSLLSLLWGHDVLSVRLVLGGLLVLGGNLLAELPGWLRSRRR